MTDINKQRFLAELGKLLTFMYEEDRQDALAMYSDMFDSGVDEQTLLHQLVSPTRQAVVIARAYNQRERTLQTDARSRRESYYQDGEDDVPGYVIAIEDIRRQILGAQESTRIHREQISLFEEVDLEEVDEAEEEPAEETRPVVPEVEQTTGEAVVEASEEERVEEAAEETYAGDTAEQSDESTEVTASEEQLIEETDKEAVSEAVAEEVSGEAVEEELFVEEEVSDSVEESDDHEEEEYRDEKYEYEEQYAHEASHRHSGELQHGHGHAHQRTFVPTERRARPLLLILYVLIAVPVGLVGGVILLLPILLFLALTIVAIWLGISAVSAAFGGFAMFSDLMVVLGAGLVFLALGLLFLWLFIWFIGGVLAGFINGLISLGGKLCYKEVEVE